MKKNVRTNNLTCGLFIYKSFWRNLKDVPIYFKRLNFLLRHGYSPMAQWETYDWFICVMREIMQNYRDNREGNMLFFEPGDETITRGLALAKQNDKFYDHMVELLNQMDEFSYADIDYEDTEKFLQQEKENENKANAAKNEFFELFSKYFYGFWD